jgi:Protein of unknown function (DUF4231)
LSDKAEYFAVNPDDYIKDRVDGQIEWYDRKSGTNQRWFRWLRIVEIVAAASIPLLVGYADSISEFKVVVGILGLLIAVIAGILGLYQFQENWNGYRTTCEALMQEKYLFLTKTQPYDQGDSFSLFVQRVENFISKEHTNWAQYIGAGGKPKDQP